MTDISVCIPTYRRPLKLFELLNSLLKQTHLPTEVVVVDNDVNGSAKAVIDRFQAECAPAFAVHYAVQPEKNISLTRNMTISLANCEWLALIDDDELPCVTWLKDLLAIQTQFFATGVLGPVITQVPAHAPQWIRKGDFYALPRLATGAVVPSNMFRIGNALLNAAMLNKLDGPFDPRFGLTGGEDGDMLSRLSQQGAKIVWSDDAVVYEPVDDSRLSFRWLFLRALRGGQDFAYHSIAGRYGRSTLVTRIAFLGRCLLQLVAAALMSIVCWPAGKHRAAYWSLKAAANFGKLSAFWGWHYREYA